MVKARTAFKSELRRSKRDYDVSQTGKLLRARKENARQNWKMLPGCYSKLNYTISCEEFASYFKCINNTDSDLFSPDDSIAEQVETVLMNDV